jgi:hypothetical protein
MRCSDTSAIMREGVIEGVGLTNLEENTVGGDETDSGRERWTPERHGSKLKI